MMDSHRCHTPWTSSLILAIFGRSQTCGMQDMVSPGSVSMLSFFDWFSHVRGSSFFFFYEAVFF